MGLLKRIKIFSILAAAFGDFRRSDPLRMAGATAFFTTFALPAVLIIIIQVFGLFVSPRLMTRQLFRNLADLFGTNTAAELHKTLSNVRHVTSNWYMAAGGFLFLIFVATTLFKVIKDSLNQLWSIKVLDHPGIAFSLLNRAKAFLTILLTGALFLAVLVAEGLMGLLRSSVPANGLWVSGIVRQAVSFVVVTIWFTMLFKFLPNARPSWKTATAGALFTGLLFTSGKLLLQWLLSHSNMQTIYGASTSSVLLLLFVFYSAFIFYYGACFTKAWADYYKQPIPPGKHAVKYRLSKVAQKK